MSVELIATVDLAGAPESAQAGAPAQAVLLIYPGAQMPQALDSDLYESSVIRPLMTAFAAVQHHWASIAGACGRVIVLAPATAALGDPERPLDAAVVGGLISFVRSVAIELHRHGATAHILLFDHSPNEPAVQAMIETLVAKDSCSVTGQEIYLANDTSLGKLHP
jgi:NAD(P)-dependent dehydrogenase (short-subunit alcohol dehydrogenase family)